MDRVFLVCSANRTLGVDIDANSLEILASMNSIMKALPKEEFYFVWAVQLPYPAEIRSELFFYYC